MWLEELEESIRKQDAFTVNRCVRLLAGTGIGFETPSQIKWAKEGPEGGLACTNTRGMTSDESILSFWTLVKAKRPRLIGKRLDPTTIAH